MTRMMWVMKGGMVSTTKRSTDVAMALRKQSKFSKTLLLCRFESTACQTAPGNHGGTEKLNENQDDTVTSRPLHILKLILKLLTGTHTCRHSENPINGAYWPISIIKLLWSLCLISTKLHSGPESSTTSRNVFPMLTGTISSRVP